MGAKENMKQAVRELIGRVPAGEKEEPETTLQEDECAQAVIRTVEEILGGKRPSAAQGKTEAKAEPAGRKGGDAPPAEAEESTVIARGTSVYGDMRSEGGIQFGGILKGDLAAAGDIVLSGRILGNVSGRNIRILGGAVQGDVAAAGTVETDENAVVIGDVTAEALTANGRQKGSVRVEKTLRLGEKAVLAGDVTAMQITMAEGAKVQLGVVVSRSGEGFPAFAELEI